MIKQGTKDNLKLIYQIKKKRKKRRCIINDKVNHSKAATHHITTTSSCIVLLHIWNWGNSRVIGHGCSRCRHSRIWKLVERSLDKYKIRFVIAISSCTESIQIQCLQFKSDKENKMYETIPHFKDLEHFLT